MYLCLCLFIRTSLPSIIAQVPSSVINSTVFVFSLGILTCISAFSYIMRSSSKTRSLMASCLHLPSAPGRAPFPITLFFVCLYLCLYLRLYLYLRITTHYWWHPVDTCVGAPVPVYPETALSLARRPSSVSIVCSPAVRKRPTVFLYFSCPVFMPSNIIMNRDIKTPASHQERHGCGVGKSIVCIQSLVMH